MKWIQNIRLRNLQQYRLLCALADVRHFTFNFLNGIGCMILHHDKKSVFVFLPTKQNTQLMRPFFILCSSSRSGARTLFTLVPGTMNGNHD